MISVRSLIAAVGLAFACTMPVAGPASAQLRQPPARLYNFGEAEINQTWLSRRDPSRTLPYHVEGVIAVPDGVGPFPVVFIFHAALGGCPIDASVPEAHRELWPCAAGEERRNDVGMAYLASAMASRGYVAIVPNLNAVYASAYGAFGPELRRYPDVLDAHLNGLIQANAEDTDALDVSIKGKLDLGRIGMIGHGHGALLAMQSARARADRPTGGERSPGSGPLIGALLVAPLYSLEGDADTPLAVILPSCDGVAPDLNGQGYYEDARMNVSRGHFAASVYLAGANHGFFNELPGADDAAGLAIGTGCNQEAARTARAAQRDFLAAYAPDFFRAAGGNKDAAVRAGLDPNSPPPSSLYGSPVSTALAMPVARRSIVLRPTSSEDLGYNGFGGYAIVAGPASIEFCDARRPCGRWPIQPGNPAQVRFTWTTPLSARWVMPLSEDGLNAADFDAIHLRTALDPSDYLNAHRTPQRLRLTLTDVSGRQAAVIVDGTTPALAYPPGMVDLRAWGWAGHVFLSSVRVPMQDFRGIDLSRVSSLELAPAGNLGGSLFVADVEFIRPPAQ
jgi:dienelactone hydrolase